MLDYIQPIYIALIVFIIIAFMIFIPWLIYIYRRFGFFPLSTTIIVFSFIFYFMAAFFLTLLPLPETTHNCVAQPIGKAYSLTPFQFVDDILRESRVDWSSPSTYGYLLQERAFLQAFFNLLLLMPLGVYLRYYLGQLRAWWKALLIIGCVTLFYEVTQLTGIYGIYDCPYRLFDVDDLMLNGFGGLVGFFLAPIVLALFPSRREIHEKAAELAARDEVRNMAVLLAMAIDLTIIQFMTMILTSVTGYTYVWSRFLLLITMLILWLVILPATSGGRTIGTRILRFRYTGDRLKIRLTKRMLAVSLVYTIQFTAYLISEMDIQADAPQQLDIWLYVFAFAISSLLFLSLFIHLIVVMFSKEKRRFFFDSYAQITTTRKMR